MKASLLARHELIGLDVSVGDHEGRVVDETKHTFLIETPSGRTKVIPKAGRRFVFRVGGNVVEIVGDEIAFQPEDRTKKVRS